MGKKVFWFLSACLFNAAAMAIAFAFGISILGLIAKSTGLKFTFGQGTFLGVIAYVLFLWAIQRHFVRAAPLTARIALYLVMPPILVFFAASSTSFGWLILLVLVTAEPLYRMIEQSNEEALGMM